MKKLLITALAALSLAGCTLADLAVGALGATAPPPVQIANQTTADERAGLLVETLYTAAARAGALAFRLRTPAPSTNPAVQRDDFCQLVTSRQFEPTDNGSRLAALECRLRAERDRARRAYDAGNSDNYDAAVREVDALARELLALTRGN